MISFKNQKILSQTSEIKLTDNDGMSVAPTSVYNSQRYHNQRYKYINRKCEKK